MSQTRILVVEDEAALRRFLRPALAAQDHQVLEAASGAEGLAMARGHNPDLVLLDLGLPDMDGLQVLKEIRAWSRRPVIIISARNQEREKVKALDMGADDYLTKPFGAMELLARIRAALRHAAQSAPQPCFRSGRLKVDLERREVSVEGSPVRLTALEYRLLEALVRRCGKVCTHAQLLQEVWGPTAAGQTHYLRIYMAQLRRRLEADPARPRHLITEPGVGYRLEVEEGGAEEPPPPPC